jgi:F-type H+-transporting ATPase subunit delta
VATDDTTTASVPGRYAAALFELAADEKAVPAVEADLDRMQSLIDESADLKRLVLSPVISADDQERALASILPKAGIGTTTSNFLRLVARNRRLFVTMDIIKAFKAMAAKARGEVAAEVTSAMPLTEAQAATLKETLKAAGGKDVTLVQRVDPAIIGGLVVKLGSRMIDSSIATKLSAMRVALKT